MVTEQDIKNLTGIDFPQAQINLWVADFEILAKKCLDRLDEDKRNLALRYLVAHFLTLQGVDGQGVMQSESLGDASWTYWTAGKGAGSAATSYGTLLKALAPCFGEFLGDKQYGAVRLIR